MALDIGTMFELTLNIEAMLGLLLLFLWVQNKSVAAMGWWGAAHLLRALSIGLYGFLGSGSDLLVIDAADAMLFTSYGVTWNGARVFDGREPRPGSLITGATIWPLACRVPFFSIPGTHFAAPG
jgi:hypothetical protein